MFGVTSCLSAICRKLRIFYATFIGVYMTEYAAYAVYLENGADGWHISGQERLSVDNVDDAAVKLRLTVAKRGWRLDSPVALCLPETSVRVMTANLRHVEPEEMVEAVYWEIRERQTEDDADFCYVFFPIADMEDYYQLSVLPQTEGKRLKDVWRENDLNLAALTVVPPEGADIRWEESRIICRGVAVDGKEADFSAEEDAWENALWAVGVLIAPGGLGQKANFYGDAATINPLRLSVAVVAVITVMLTFLSCFDYYRLSVAQAEVQEVEANLRLLQSERQSIADIERTWAKYRLKAQTIKALTDQRLPWHGLMVHLGSLPMAGVYLTVLELTEEGSLKMQGYAANYDGLSDFLAVLEQRVNSRVNLTDATASNEDKALHFTLELKLSDVP